MEIRAYPREQLTRRIVTVALLGSVGTLAGVAAIFTLGEAGLAVGIALIALTGVVEVLLVLRAVWRAPCPGCGDVLVVRDGSGRRVCERCRVAWEMPRTS